MPIESWWVCSQCSDRYPENEFTNPSNEPFKDREGKLWCLSCIDGSKEWAWCEQCEERPTQNGPCDAPNDLNSAYLCDDCRAEWAEEKSQLKTCPVCGGDADDNGRCQQSCEKES